VARKEPMLFERRPWACDVGQRVWTTVWIAFRDVCSPGFWLLSGVLIVSYLEMFSPEVGMNGFNRFQMKGKR